MSKALDWLKANLTREKIINAAKHISEEDIPPNRQSTDYAIWVKCRAYHLIYLLSEKHKSEKGEGTPLGDPDNYTFDASYQFNLVLKFHQKMTIS